MKKILLALTVVTLLFSGTSQTVYENAQDGRIWLKVKDDYVFQKQMFHVSQQDQRSEMEKSLEALPFLENLGKVYGITNVTAPFAHFKAPKLKLTYEITFSDYASVDEFIRVLEKNPAVEYVERVPLDRKTLTPNDPSYSPGQQWALFRIQASQAWDQSVGNSSIVIAVVDDAVDIDHPDLSPIRWVNTGEIPGNGIDDDGNGYTVMVM